MRHTALALVVLAATLACGATAARDDDVPDAAEVRSDVALDAAPDQADDAPGEADAPSGDTVASLPCNGHTALCGRRFDQVAYVTTHNAMANAADGFKLPNQDDDVPTQLAKGVRAFMLDTHDEAGVVMLCHSVCQLGKKPLVETLTALATFLEANPREVVSILFESYVTEAATAAVFDEAGLLPRVRAQAPGEPWPTLNEMIAADTRLVVFSDNATGTVPWHLPVWDHAFETHWSAKTVDDFSCAPNRGDPANPLFILNHFLTNPAASKTLAAEANANPFFLERAEACQQATGQLPNFVTVDFATIGDVGAVVDALNGVD